MRRIRKELLILGSFLFIGIVLVPIATYVLGNAVFVDYQQYDGMGAFLRIFFGQLGSGHGPTWFIALSPFLVICCLRLAWLGVRGRRAPREAAAEAANGE